jgi:hypothetical protein
LRAQGQSFMGFVISDRALYGAKASGRNAKTRASAGAATQNDRPQRDADDLCRSERTSSLRCMGRFVAPLRDADAH